jgi:ribose transport system substrate-binding protein
MKKKMLIATMILVLSITAILAGCGNAGNSAGGDTEDQESQTSAADENATENAADGGFKVGFSNGYYGNTWRDQFIKDFEDVAEEYKSQGVINEYTVSNADTDADQIAAMNKFIAEGYDAICVVPRVASALAPVVKKATDNGIIVICLDDSDWEGAYNVVLDNYNTMEVCTEWLVNELGGKGDIVYITGVPGENWDTVRNDAVKAVLEKYPDINILGEAPGSWSDVDANQAMTTFLNTYKELDGVLAQDVMGRGIYQAFQTAQRPPVPFNGDSVNGFLNIWKEDSSIDTFIYTFPPGIGATGLKVAVGLLQGKEFKDESLSENVVNPTLKNSVVIPIPYYIIRDLPTDEPEWKKAMNPGSKLISLDEAIKVNEGQDDNVTMDYIMPQEEVDALFK